MTHTDSCADWAGSAVGAAQLAAEDTSTDGPDFAATPEVDGPRPQDRRGRVRVRGAPFMLAQ